MPTPCQWTFGPFRLDLDDERLWRGTEVLPLRQKTWAVLCALVTRAGQLMTKDALFAAVWPETTVSESVLTGVIRELRQVLGEQARHPQWIETVHGRGYRFMAPVTMSPLPNSFVSTAVATATPLATDRFPAQVREPETTGIPRLPWGTIALQGEHKVVTVLVCTLSQTAVMVQRRDAEDWHQARQACVEMLLEEVTRYAGTLQHVLEDRALILFGAPVAHEDHAQRAVRAALNVHQRLHAQRPARAGLLPAAWVVGMGLHTGPIVLGRLGQAQALTYTPVGDTIALATWLAQQAAPGTVLVSAATQKRMADAFEVRPVGEHHVDGPERPIQAFEVVRDRVWWAGAATVATRGLTPHLGRQRELATLGDLWQQVQAGHGQVVGIVGEPGMGKSRLLAEFLQRVHSAPVAYLEGHCQSYGRTIPYLPVRDIVRQACSMTDGDRPEAIITKVHLGLQDVGMDPEANAPYLLHLLGLSAATDHQAVSTPEAFRHQTVATLCQMLLQRSRQQPLIIGVENLQWGDPSSEASFSTLVEELAGVPLCVLTTSRPGYHPPWMHKSYATQLALHRLPPQDSQMIVHAVAQGQSMAEPLVHDIVTRAEGNPLFLEEITLATLEQGHLSATLMVPDTIQGVLTARIDQLPPATKEVLQTAAVLGREAPFALLERLWQGEGDLAAHLQALKQQELLYVRSGGHDLVYRFKHALTQEVAYASLLLAHRQSLHAAAGQTLEGLYAERPEAVYDRLAYHYARTPEAAKALTYLTHLAERAMRSHAHVEAVAAWRDALAQLEAVPATSDVPSATRARQGLALCLRLAFSLTILGHFQEALALLLPYEERLEQLDDTALVGPYYVRLSMTYHALGEQEQAASYGQRAVTAAEGRGDTVTMGQAYYALALARTSSGSYLEAVACGQQAVALLEGTTEQHYLGLTHRILGMGYWSMGAFSEALAAATRLEAIATATGDPRLRSVALVLPGRIYALQGEWEAGIAAAQRGLASAPDPLCTAMAQQALSQAYLAKPDPVQALACAEQALRHYRQMRFRQGEAQCLCLLGEAQRQHGDLASAHALAAQALRLNRAVNNGYGVGVAQRLLGRLAQDSGALGDADQYYTEALATFAALPARYELGRTHLDLVTLARAQGRLTVAASHLRTAHGLFASLQVPRYVERTVHLAREYGVSLSERSA